MNHTIVSLLRAGAAALSLGVLAACGASAPVAELPIKIDPAAAALVNGEKIFVGDVELEAVARGLVTPGEPIGPGDAAYTTVLNELIDQKLMAQEAQRRGLENDPVSIRRLEMARERILGNLLVESLVAQEVTDESIDRMYEEQVRLQQSNDEVAIAHILVETRDQAEALLAKISRGASFESLVVNNSRDTATRMEGGNLGYVLPNEQPEPFPVIIANTREGEVSEPFESERGWHILKVKDRRTQAPMTRDEMRPEIATFLTLNEVSNILRRLRAEATIEQGEGRAFVPTQTPALTLPDETPPSDADTAVPPPRGDDL